MYQPNRAILLTVAAFSCWVVLVTPQAGAQVSAQTDIASVASGGSQGDLDSWGASVSADGRFVAFASDASNLVSSDRNGVSDIFVHDRQLMQTVRVSLSSTGAEANGPSGSPSLSADGRYVAFASDASNLVEGDDNGFRDVFRHDRFTGETVMVSLSDRHGRAADSFSTSPTISGDGQRVAFVSKATDLIPGFNDSNGYQDVYFRDYGLGRVLFVSVGPGLALADGPSESPRISADGRWLTFTTLATNLIEGDTNDVADVMLQDLQAFTTTRVSVASDGSQADGISRGSAVSADGRFVVFASEATNLVDDDTNAVGDVFVHERGSERTTRVSLGSNGAEGDQVSCCPSISGDGRWVGFESLASNLVTDDSNGLRDAFVHDVETQQTIRVSVGGSGTEANGPSQGVCVATGALAVAFESTASNLVPQDVNGRRDVFVRSFEAGPGPVALFSFSPSLAEVGDPIHFTDGSLNQPTNWSWDFGDGASSTEQSPSHVFSAPGEYTVTLVVSNAFGSDADSRQIEVYGEAEPLPAVYLVPAASRAAGAEGSFFVTDVDVKNTGSETASFRFAWLPRNANNASPALSEGFDLPPGASVRFPDVLSSVFRLADGAVGALGIDSNSDALRVMSRTFNLLEDGSTFGQGLPGIPVTELIRGGDRAQILFFSEDDGYRSNLGVASGVDFEIRILFERFAPNGTSLGISQLTLRPFENTQVNRVFGNWKPITGASIVVWSDTPGAAFAAYGSVLDSVTSDPTTVLPQ